MALRFATLGILLALMGILMTGCGENTRVALEVDPRLRPITDSMGQPEPMPAIVRKVFARNGHQFSVNALPYSEAQHLGGLLTGGLWVVEGRHLTCIVLDRPSASACDSTDEARSSGLYVQTYETAVDDPSARRNFIAAGVLPSGYGFARARIAGEYTAVKVHDGLFVFRAQQPIEVLLPN